MTIIMLLLIWVIIIKISLTVDPGYRCRFWVLAEQRHLCEYSVQNENVGQGDEKSKQTVWMSYSRMIWNTSRMAAVCICTTWSSVDEVHFDVPLSEQEFVLFGKVLHIYAVLQTFTLKYFGSCWIYFTCGSTILPLWSIFTPMQILLCRYRQVNHIHLHRDRAVITNSKSGALLQTDN